MSEPIGEGRGWNFFPKLIAAFKILLPTALFGLGLAAHIVHMNTTRVPLDPQELQDLLDELERSRHSRRRAWENLQEIRWVLKDVTGVELPAPARKTIDLKGRIVKDGVRKAIKDRQLALEDLVKAIREFRKYTDQPLTLRGGDLAPRTACL